MNKNKWILPGKSLSLELSSVCQARCKMCPFELNPNKNKHMEFELFKKCVDEGAKHGLETLDLCLMGDSLLDKGFVQKMEYIKSYYPDIKVYASSQGMSIDVDTCCKYVDTLHVSFYGTTKEVYEKVHGGGVRYEKSLDNVERLLARPNAERPYVIFTFLILPENEHQLDEWLGKWEDIADEVIVWRPHNWAGIFDDETKNDIYQNGVKPKSCGRPINGPFCIWVNGDVTPCCFSWDKRLVIGNVYNETLEQIYYSDRRRQIMIVHENNAFQNCSLPCEKCDQVLSRKDALVYTNHDRRVDRVIYGDTEGVLLKE